MSMCHQEIEVIIIMWQGKHSQKSYVANCMQIAEDSHWQAYTLETLKNTQKDQFTETNASINAYTSDLR